MQETDLFSGLSKFGLSPYEIKIYVTLLILGPQNSTSAVKNAGVPQPRIYDLFNSLIRKGFIEVSPGKKRVYRAIPVEMSLRKKVVLLDSYINEFEEYVEQTRINKSAKSPYLWLIESQKKIDEKISSMISGARNEIILSLSAARLKSLTVHIKSALSRGVTIALVLFSDSTDDDIKALPREIIIRKRNESAAEVVLADRREGMINVSSMQKSSQFAHYFEEDELIHVLNYYFYHILWIPSTHVSDFTARNYRNLCTSWLACEAIDSYFANGYELKGSVEGFMGDRLTTIDGRIVGTDRILGIRQTFFIHDGHRTYSVGGKTGHLEDMRFLHLRISVGPSTKIP